MSQQYFSIRYNDTYKIMNLHPYIHTYTHTIVQIEMSFMSMFYVIR